MNFIFFSILSIATIKTPMFSGAFAVLAIASVVNLKVIARLIAYKVYLIFRKPMKSIPKGFTITNVEMTKPIDYLHETYPNKNDAEILQIREEEMIKLLDKACKAFDKSDHNKHFKIAFYYGYGRNKELVSRFEPLTPFANSFLSKVMEHKFKEAKYYSYDDEEEGEGEATIS
jgi:hypothetical protein